ncbi:hypothetical protein NBRGN_066_00450 [Nocardia brasiliensis NBRC 14402]|nr:hypothetical protein NBRGN_066_00450 [Nocardia brasiliensis NBRC 14402]
MLGTVLGTGKVLVGNGSGTALVGNGTSVVEGVGAPRLVVAAGVGEVVSLEQAVSSQLLKRRVPAVSAAAVRGAFIEDSFPATPPIPAWVLCVPTECGDLLFRN